MNPSVVTVDARGLSCPEPVLVTKKQIDGMKSGHVTVLVDTNAARDNVARMARSRGWSVTIRQNPEETVLELVKE